MSLPIVTIALVALLAVSSEAGRWNGLVASWDADVNTHYYDLPQTLEAAEDEGWTEISGVNPPSGSVGLGYYDDPTVVLIFNSTTGAVFALQVGFPKADVEYSEQPLQYGNISSVFTKTLNGVVYYTATAFFQTDESTDENQLWFLEGDHLLEIPTNASRISSETDFLLKNCVPTMGGHYYALNYTSSCEYGMPWFIITDNDYVIGIGFQGSGTTAAVSDRVWYEDIPGGALLHTIPDAPVCAQEAIDNYGVISLHFWFVNNAKTITCT